jgi:ribonuclease HI
MSDLKKITIHSDGACQGNPGPGGWAAILEYQGHLKEIAGGNAATTNNRMEIQAALAALRSLKQRCEVQFFTDSEYVRDGITRWLAGWKRFGWRTKDRKPVRNQDLWRELDAACTPHVIHWHWLKGHAGHPLNERCDQLAVTEIAKIRKQHTPDQLNALLRDFEKQRSEQQEKKPDLLQKKNSDVIQKALNLPGI